MHGSLAYSEGVLWVGRHARTAHVAAYDLDGHALGPRFSFRGADGARASIGGLCVDSDRTLWIADTAAARVRSFSVFGVEGVSLGNGETDGRPDRRDLAAHVGEVVSVAASGEDDERRVWVASRGRRRHAVQSFTPDGRYQSDLRPQGDPNGVFEDVRDIARLDRFTYVCEGRGGRVQVFRDDEFHFAFGRDVPGLIPSAVEPLEDGRVLVAGAGDRSGLYLFDEGGRILSELATHGEEGGRVFEPDSVRAELYVEDARRRVCVMDSDGDRVQVFTLEGQCYGSFSDLPRSDVT